MRMLELFCGTGIMSSTFKRYGFDIDSVDLDIRFDCIHCDAYAYLLEHSHDYDVIWAGPDCRTYSYATHRHRGKGSHDPLTDYAKWCDEHNEGLFRMLKGSGAIFFIENPAGHMQYMDWAQDITRYRTASCVWGGQFRKPTDIWSNIDLSDIRPPCSPGAPCHCHVISGNSYLHGPSRASYPPALCRYIANKSIEALKSKGVIA